MSDDDKPDNPDPIEDVRKGLGLLFRAAKSAIDQLPKRGIEDAVMTGAREVGRAIENVTSTLDKQFFKRDKGPENARSAPPPASDADASTGSHTEPETPPEQKGPRIG